MQRSADPVAVSSRDLKTSGSSLTSSRMLRSLSPTTTPATRSTKSVHRSTQDQQEQACNGLLPQTKPAAQSCNRRCAASRRRSGGSDITTETRGISLECSLLLSACPSPWRTTSTGVPSSCSEGALASWSPWIGLQGTSNLQWYSWSSTMSIGSLMARPSPASIPSSRSHVLGSSTATSPSLCSKWFADSCRSARPLPSPHTSARVRPWRPRFLTLWSTRSLTSATALWPQAACEAEKMCSFSDPFLFGFISEARRMVPPHPHPPKQNKKKRWARQVQRDHCCTCFGCFHAVLKNDLHMKGAPEGVGILLRKLRGENVDWQAFRECRAPTAQCSKCDMQRDISHFTDPEWELARAIRPATCIVCSESVIGERRKRELKTAKPIHPCALCKHSKIMDAFPRAQLEQADAITRQVCLKCLHAQDHFVCTLCGVSKERDSYQPQVLTLPCQRPCLGCQPVTGERKRGWTTCRGCAAKIPTTGLTDCGREQVPQLQVEMR